MSRKQVYVNVGTVGHVDRGLKKALIAEGLHVLEANTDKTEDSFAIELTMPPEMPEFTITKEAPTQYGPRKKRGKGNKYHRV